MKICLDVSSQNLVNNGGFEDLTTCPTNFGQINFTNSWYDPSGSTPDLFNICSSNPDVSVPWNSNNLSYQFPKSGDGYAGINCFYTSSLVREYLQQSLKQELDSGNKYCACYYLNLSNPMRYCIDNMGLYISNYAISCSPGYCALNVSPHIRYPVGEFLCDTLSWMKICVIYFSTGGEKYISIGNLQEDSFTNYYDFNSFATYQGTYYYIDDVSLTLCRPPVIPPDTLFIDYGSSVMIGDTAEDVANYFWSPSEGLVCDSCWQTSASPLETTTYILTKITPCDTTADTVTIVVEDPPVFSFTVYPNPTDGKITISYTSPFDVKLKIFNSIGQLVARDMMVSGYEEKYELVLPLLSSGVYYLMFYDENGEVGRERLVVVR